MSIYHRMKKAKEVAKKHNSNRLGGDKRLSEEDLDSILQSNGLAYEITGSSSSVPSHHNPLLNVSITIHVYETDGEDRESREEYYSVVVEADENYVDVSSLAIEGSRKAKHLFLCCKLGVPVGDSSDPDEPIAPPIPTHRPMDFEQIRKLTAQTI